MGSGFNFFTNAVLFTLTTTGLWEDMDASAYIPVGSTGVIVKIVNEGSLAVAVRGAVRKNGSTDEFYETVDIHYLRFAVTGVDANRLFEAIGNATDTKIYLIGYTDENVGLFTNAVDKTPSVGAWNDVDASANIPVGSTGVICHIINLDVTTVRAGGIRKNGSTDTFTYGNMNARNRYVYQICGVDANRIFEAYVDTNVSIKLQGYTKSPIILWTNALDKSTETTLTWVDTDLTADTYPTADGAILFIKNTAYVALKGDVRHRDSTDDHTADATLFILECRGAFIGLNIGNALGQWINSTSVDLYLIGWTSPLPVVVVKKPVGDGLTWVLA